MDTKLTKLLPFISKNIAYLALKQELVFLATSPNLDCSSRASYLQRNGGSGFVKNLFSHCSLFLSFLAISTLNISAQCSTSDNSYDEGNFLTGYICASESTTFTADIIDGWEFTDGNKGEGKFSSSRFSAMNLNGTTSPAVIIPQITVDKDDDDNTDDFQIVPEGGTALFFINITNSGTENLCNLVISDPNGAGCELDAAGIAMLISDSGDFDNDWEPGEVLSYPCEVMNVSASFTNTMTVTAEGCNSGIVVSAEDASEVFVPCEISNVMVEQVCTGMDVDDDTYTICVSFDRTGVGASTMFDVYLDGLAGTPTTSIGSYSYAAYDAAIAGGASCFSVPAADFTGDAANEEMGVQVCISDSEAAAPGTGLPPGSMPVTASPLPMIECFACTTFDEAICCEFAVNCPTNLFLGEYACDDPFPICPTTEAEAAASPYNIDFSANDPCGTVVVLCEESGVAFLCEEYTITQTITIVDDLNGNNMLDSDEEAQVCVFSYDVMAPDPSMITCPADTTVTCEDDIVIGQASAACSHEVFERDTVGPNLVSGTANCPGAVYEIVYTIFDACSQTSSCTQTITLETPNLVVICPDNVVGLTCGQALPFAETELMGSGSCTSSNIFQVVSATDDMDPATFSFCPADAPFTVTRTYVVQDACGTTTSCNQTFAYNESSIAPTITCPADETVMCAEDIVAGMAMVTTDCTLGSTIMTMGPTLVAGIEDCDGATYELTYTVTDNCGRVASCKQTFTLANMGPSISCPVDMTVMCAADISIGTASVTTDCGVGSTVETSGPTLVSGMADCDGAMYEIFYSAADDCGRTASCTQTFTLSNSGPMITCPMDVTVDCAANIMAGTATVTTDCGVGAMVTSEGPTLVSGMANCDGAAYEIVYTATDDCNRTSSCTQTFTLSNSGPVITCPMDETVDCAADIMAGTATATTDCAVGSMITSGSPTLVSGMADCDGATYEIVYTATDDCNRTESCTQTFTLSNSGPVITCPMDATAMCAADIIVGTPVVTTDCGVGFTVATEGPILATGTGDCDGATYEIKYTATDACGRTAFCIQTITVNDEMAPVAPTPPMDVMVQCADDVPAPVDLTAVDNCNGDIVASPAEMMTPGSCTNNFVLIRTWTFTDVCDNESSVMQTITVNDNMAPVPPTAPADVTVQCATDVPASIDLTAMDNCDGNITVSPTEGNTPGSCTNNFVLIRTWTFTDVCGNESSVMQTITVNDDMAPVPPTAPADVTVQCATDVPASIDLTAMDNCDGNITVSPTEGMTTGSCINNFVIIRTWTFTDVCGNESSVMQTITVNDDMAPVPPAAPSDVMVQCAADVPMAVDLTAVDNCDGNITASTAEAMTSGSCTNNFVLIRTWTFTDVCGNESSVMQTITVNDDMAPVPPAAPADVMVQCAADVPMAVDLTAVDNCDGNITVSPTEMMTPGSCINNFIIIRTWTFTDVCGNESSVMQTITVNDDMAPVAPAAPADVMVQCAADVPMAVDLTAVDNCDGNIIASATESVTPGSCINNFVLVRTWTFTDVCGNESSVMQTITVDDDMAPVAPAAPADVMVQCAADVPMTVDLTAVDNCDGNITVSPTESVTPGSCTNNFVLVRTWTFTDVCGNESSVMQTITVNDDMAPVAPAAPSDEMVQCAADVPMTVDLTAVDNCDENITVSPTESMTPGSCENNFVLVRTWTFTDVCGNESSVMQTITVNDDMAPVPPAAPADAMVQCASDVPAQVDLTAVDNCDGNITVSPTESVTPGSCANNFVLVRTWTFTDVCGNESSVMQTITVNDDMAPVPPAAPADVMVQCAADVPMAVDLTAVDNCDGTIIASATESVTPGSCINNFVLVRTWTFTDVCDNESSVMQTITVNDDMAPVAPMPLADVAVQCAEEIPAGVNLTAVDNCDGDITVSPTEEITAKLGACPNDFVLVRTWTFTDVCGNESSVMQTITVNDDIAPTAICQNVEIIIDPSGTTTITPDMIDNGSTDNCVGSLGFSLSKSNFTCDNIGANPVQLTVTDECGNTSSCDAIVTVLRGVEPPKVWSTTYCIEKLIASEPGIQAMCAADCENADIIWYDAEVDGNIVGTGEFFNPITAGLVANNEIGCFTYFAECGCSTTACRSLRTAGVFESISCDVACTEACLYTLILEDSGFNGWEGASIDVSINGGAATEYKLSNSSTCSSGYMTIPIQVQNGETIGLGYWQGGNDIENAWRLLDAVGNTVEQSGFDAMNCNTIVPTVATGEEMLYDVICPECCTDDLSPFTVRITLGDNPDFLSWEVYDGSVGFQGAQVFGITANTYAGLAPGTQINYPLDLEACNEYTVALFDGGADGWDGATFEIFSTDIDYGVEIMDANDAFFGQSLIKFLDEDDFNNLVNPSSNEARMAFTVPCKPDCEDATQMVVPGDCFSEELILPLAEPVICFPDCNHAIGCDIQVRQTILIDQNDQNAILLSDFMDFTGQTEIDYEGIAENIQAGCHSYVTEYMYCDEVITKCTSSYTVFADDANFACNDNINVPLTPPDNLSTGGSDSLSDDLGECVRLITADMVIEAGQISNQECEFSSLNDFYQVIILDANDQPLITYSANGLPLDSNGNEIQAGQNTVPANNFVSYNEVKQTLKYKITHKVTGNSCGGFVTIEDKNAPTIVCTDYDVNCNDPNILDEFYSKTDTILSSASSELPANIAGGTAGNISSTWIPFTVPCGRLGTVLEDIQVNVDIEHNDLSDLGIELFIPNKFNNTLANPFPNGVLQMAAFGNVDATNIYSASNTSDLASLLGQSCENLESAKEVDFISETNASTAVVGLGETWYLRVRDNSNTSFADPVGGGEVISASIIISCGFPFPYFALDCNLDDVELISEVLETDCDLSVGNYSGRVVRVWKATDACGQSSTCTQLVNLTAPRISDLTLPGDVVEIECGTQVLLSDGTVDPAQSGAPEFGCDLVTNEDLCKLSISYEDDIIESCGISYKVLRTWQILNWCGSNNTPQEFTQLIIVGDHTGPEINLATEITIQANANCGGFVDLSGIDVTDECSDVTGLRIQYITGSTYSGGSSTFIVDLMAGNPVTGLPTGPTEATIIATDDCGNSSELDIIINVLDDANPIAICDNGLTISLDNKGMARLYATDFDEGSHDNCSSIDLAIKSNGCVTGDFAEFADVSCCDLGEVRVELLVTDAGGNTNTCWADILIEDPVAPTIECSSDVTITCNDVQLADELFSAPDAYDACGASIEAGDIVTIDLPNCGQLLTRTYTASDASVKSNDETCTQSVTVMHVSDFIVQFPADELFTNCALEDIPGPVITEDDCEHIAISTEDRVFVQVEDACYKIERTYTIINHCIVENSSAGGFTDLGTPLPVPNTFRDDDGYFQYTQVIKVLDAEAPTITFTVPDECDFTDGCEGFVELVASAEDICSEVAAVELRYQIDEFSDGTYDAEFSGNDASGIYPYGDHIIRWIAADGCGNEIVKEFTFSIKDCKNPTPVCQDITTVVMNNGECVAVQASDLLKYAEDNCTERTAEEWNDNVRIRRAGDSGASTTSIDLCCSDLVFGGAIAVELWVEDEAGNADFCLVTVFVQDNGDNCPETGAGSSAIISGVTATELNKSVENVSVFVGNDRVMTNAAGIYASNQPKDVMYTVTPEKLDGVAEGISTFDLVLLAQHVLQINELSTPYQLIAADINNDKKVDILDMVELRQLILYAIDNFSNNTSWRFVDKDYIFQNPTSPWSEDYPQSIAVMLDNDKMHENFVAVKIGDLDGNASNFNSKSTEERINSSLRFMINDLDLIAGNAYQLDFRASDFVDILGYQFTLDFDQNVLDFISVEAGALQVDKGNFGYTMLDEGIITTSFTEMGKSISINNDEILFSLNFTAKSNAILSDLIKLTNKYTKAEAYALQQENHNLSLVFTQADPVISTSTPFELFQNNPNPFTEKTMISFYLPESTKASLKVYDVTGKVVFSIADKFDRGYHEIDLNAEAFKTSGTLYYQFNSEKYSATRKMILLH